jgi:penicillin-binding protein 1A
LWENAAPLRQSWNGHAIMRLLVRFLGFLFAAGTVVFLVAWLPWQG